MSNASGYLRHFTACHQHDLSRFVPFSIGGKRFGFVTHELAALLPRETGVFEVDAEGIELDPSLTSFEARSAALHKASLWVAARYGKQLRQEMYAVVEKWGDAPLAQIDRAAIPWFGVRAWGVHVNGFVRKEDGIYLWIGERAADRLADPGKLDNMIGGGQPIGLSLMENVCKEAKEEAGIDAPLALTSKQVGALDYRWERPDGIRNDTLFICDLELPEDFTPQNTDGEVAAFHLMPLSEVAAFVRDTDKFKLNCNLVIIDFLMRHGFIDASDAAYGELARWTGWRF